MFVHPPLYNARNSKSAKKSKDEVVLGGLGKVRTSNVELSPSDFEPQTSYFSVWATRPWISGSRYSLEVLGLGAWGLGLAVLSLGFGLSRDLEYLSATAS